MAEETALKPKLIVNEVVVVGRLKNPDDKTPIQLAADATPADVAKAIRDKFKFVRISEPVKGALDAGVKEGEFIHIRLSDLGGEIYTKGSRTLRLNKETTDPGYNVVFKSTRMDLFNELKGEIIANKFKPVANDPNSGEIILTEFGVTGLWDKFPLGFKYNVQWYDPKQGGKLVPFLSPVKQPDGTYKRVQAVSNIGQHFVYQDDYINLEFLREGIREKLAQWKIQPVLTNTDDRGIKDVPAPPEIVVPPTTKTDDDV